VRASWSSSTRWMGRLFAEKAGPGGAFYVAFETKHLIKNVGTVPAKYFVVAIGGDAK